MNFVGNYESSNLVTVKWIIVVGGWKGSKSVIKKIGYGIKKSKEHDVSHFEVLKNHFRIIINENSITVKNMTNNEILLLVNDPDITKNDLKYMVASGGWGGEGLMQFAISSAGQSTNRMFETR